MVFNISIILVGGFKHFLFSIYGNVIIPTDELIFFRGVAQPPISVLMVIINGDNGYGVSNGDLMFNDEKHLSISLFFLKAWLVIHHQVALCELASDSGAAELAAVGLKRQRSVEGMGCGAFLGDSMGNKW